MTSQVHCLLDKTTNVNNKRVHLPFLTAKQRQQALSSSLREGFTRLANTNTAKFKSCKTAVELYEARTHPSTLNDFALVWFDGGGLKTMLAVARWGQTHTSVFHHREEPIDPLLSPFANFVANKLLVYEDIYGVKTLHSTLFTIFTCALGSFRHSFEMKNNVLCSGISQSGKSFIGEMLCDHLMIPGTVTRVTRATDRALETTADYMYTTFLHDEVQPSLLGIGKGTGDPVFKSILSAQRVETMVFYIDKDGSRKSRIDTNPLVSTMIGNTNSCTSNIPEALKSRYYIRTIVDLDRPGHDVIEKKFAQTMANSAVVSTRCKRRTEEQDFQHQKLGFLLAVIEQMIHVGILEEPCMTVAHVVFRHLCDFITTQGFQDGTSTRDMTRLLNQARTLTIMYAAQIVFNTSLVFLQPPDKFEFAQVLRCQPFLFCTEEIALFAFTSMLNMFVDPNEAVVIQALVKGNCGYDHADDPTATTAKFRKRGDEIDDNYLQIDSLHPDRGETILMAAAKLTKSFIPDTRMSIETITDIFTSLSARRMNTLPVIEFDKCRMYVQRQFVDFTYTDIYRNIGRYAVESYIHPYLRPRDVITGVTYNTSIVTAHMSTTPIIAPHIYKCVPLKPSGAPLRLPGGVVVDGDFEQLEYVKYMISKVGYIDQANSPAALEESFFARAEKVNYGIYPLVVLDKYITEERARLKFMKGDGGGDSYTTRFDIDAQQTNAEEFEVQKWRDMMNRGELNHGPNGNAPIKLPKRQRYDDGR